MTTDMTEYCDHCQRGLDAGQIGLCDDCQAEGRLAAMKNYNVRVTRTETFVVTVRASSEESASDAAVDFLTHGATPDDHLMDAGDFEASFALEVGNEVDVDVEEEDGE